MFFLYLVMIGRKRFCEDMMRIFAPLMRVPGLHELELWKNGTLEKWMLIQ